MCTSSEHAVNATTTLKELFHEECQYFRAQQFVKYNRMADGAAQCCLKHIVQKDDRLIQQNKTVVMTASSVELQSVSDNSTFS
jgi:hypothetical protein